MVIAEAPEKLESEARVKAAAWAWYQRSGGSVNPVAGRSEAFATRCATRLSTSRFQREAAMRARTLASQALAISDSTLTSFSSIGNSSSLSHCTASFGDTTDPEDSLSPDQSSNPDSSIADEPLLDLVTLHPTACWDCGSSLFDSFELVAMSKKLDHELHEPSIDAELGLCSDSSRFSDYQQQQVLPLCNTPFNAVSPPTSPPRLFDAHDTFNTYDKLISVSDKNSKQAVYDMFCRYGVDAAKHVSRQTNKWSTIADISTCGGETRKNKGKSGRMSFQNLTKALHNIRHPYAQSISSTAIAPQDQHHHHHLHYRPHPLPKSTEKVLCAQGAHHNGVSQLGERLHYGDASVGGLQQKQRHIHHHHHHHYHYLFHSEDDFQMQPLDKSLMVAAAGLRSPKVKAALSNYLESPGRGTECGLDYGRKWADYVSLPSPAGSNYFQ